MPLSTANVCEVNYHSGPPILHTFATSLSCSSLILANNSAMLNTLTCCTLLQALSHCCSQHNNKINVIGELHYKIKIVVRKLNGKNIGRL